MTFIPHYYCEISPFALFVLAVVVIGKLAGWVACMIADRRER